MENKTMRKWKYVSVGLGTALIMIASGWYRSCSSTDELRDLRRSNQILKVNLKATEDRLLDQNIELIDAVRDRDEKIAIKSDEIIRKDTELRSAKELAREALERANNTETPEIEIIELRDTIFNLQEALARAEDIILWIGMPISSINENGTKTITFPPGTITGFLVDQLNLTRRVADNNYNMWVDSKIYISGLEAEVEALGKEIKKRKIGGTIQKVVCVVLGGTVVYLIARGNK